MVLVLFVITLVCSAGVGVIYNATLEPISAAKLAKKLNALQAVLPAFDNEPTEAMKTVDFSGESVYVYPAYKGETVVGYAVETFTNNGFSGTIRLMVGFNADGTIKDIAVLEQAETPGLGAKITDPGNPVKLSFMGKNPSELKMSVKKDGGDIDAITASTISSRAYVDAVDRAYKALQSVKEEE